MPPTSTDDTLSIFCRNVACIRRRQGLTQKEMALILGIGIRSLRMLEKGCVPENLGVQMLIPLARLAGVRVSTLFHELLADRARG